MPISFRAYPDIGVTLFRFLDHVDGDDQFRAYKAYAESDQYDPSFHLLVDQSDCQMPTASFEEACLLVARLRGVMGARAASSRTVCVCPDDDQFASERIYAGVAEYHLGRAPTICRTWAEALRALDLDASEAEALLAESGAL